MVRLLFDQNLSYRLVAALGDLFPDSVHARDIGLASADDDAVWRHAREAGMTIVTKDGDFHQMSFVHGPPPKIVWLRVGNCTTDEAEALIRLNARSISSFVEDAEESLLVIPG